MSTDAEIAAFVRSFEDHTLPKAEWAHAGHLVVALWYLRRLPRSEATARIRDGIQGSNLSLGNATGYHETVTLAWAEMIDGFLAGRDRSRPVAELARELAAAVGRPDDLTRFDSPEVLRSEAARAYWVPPDRSPIA